MAALNTKKLRYTRMMTDDPILHSGVQQQTSEPKATKGKDGLLRILSLDGGGSKGFYTLGILRELEAMLGKPLHEAFDIVFGTSTGAIIAALIGLGRDTETIHSLYKEHVPRVMKPRLPSNKSAALRSLADTVFDTATFADMKTGVGIVATKWVLEQPMIFKCNIAQAHGRHATFKPGFGVLVSDAVQASCSAYPVFKRKTVQTSTGDVVELIDGGYCANNPSLYAIADAVAAMNAPLESLRVVSLGVGGYPSPKYGHIRQLLNRYIDPLALLQTTLEVNSRSMEQLRSILFKQVQTVRISDSFPEPEMATDFVEHDLTKLNLLRQRGAESFASRETELRECLLPKK